MDALEPLLVEVRGGKRQGGTEGLPEAVYKTLHLKVTSAALALQCRDRDVEEVDMYAEEELRGLAEEDWQRDQQDGVVPYAAFFNSVFELADSERGRMGKQGAGRRICVTAKAYTRLVTEIVDAVLTPDRDGRGWRWVDAAQHIYPPCPLQWRYEEPALQSFLLPGKSHHAVQRPLCSSPNWPSDDTSNETHSPRMLLTFGIALTGC